MMKIAIDVSPLESGHKYRGVGSYLANLKDALIAYFPKNDYFFFTNPSEIPGDFGIVHFPYFDPFSFNAPSSKERKTVVTVHDLIPIIFKDHFPAGIKGNFRWQIQKRKLRKVDGVITVSLSSKSDIKEFVGVPDEKIHVVHLAPSNDFKKMSKPENKFHLPDDFLLYVGDVTWNKNLPRIVEAVKRSNKTLVLVGKAIAEDDFDRSNPWNNDLIKVHSETDNDSRFIKLGFVSNTDLNNIYNLASALIMPSLYEGFGMPILEAMAAGCPVITSEAGSLKEVAVDGAIFVDPQSVESISSGIDKLRDKKLRESLSEKGLVRAKEFSWKETARKTVEVYEKVVKNNG